MAGRILGIDLGTTNSCMAVLEGDAPSVVVNSEGSRTTPSIVAYTNKGDRIVGKAAQNQAVQNYESTAYSVKRFIGRSYSELGPQDLQGLAYKVIEDDKQRPALVLPNAKLVKDNGSDQVLPEEISAAVLSKMKADAEKILGEEITEAVITVPAYFNDNQRQATKDAGKIAGLNVQRIINEPTAAAIAYGATNSKDGVTRILVFDLGGGTFDVSILESSADLIQVISSAGDNHLGGDLWDSEFASWLCDKFKEENGKDPRDNPQEYARVLSAARSAKEDLSQATSVTVNIPFLSMKDGTPLHMDIDVTREQFESATANLLARLKKPVEDALASAQDGALTMDDIDDVLLVGGSTRMPSVAAFVRELYGKDPKTDANPDEVVALGAAIQGGVLSGESSAIVLNDVNSMSLGIKTYPDRVAVMIPKNTTIPTEVTKMFTTNEDNQSNVEIVLVQGEEQKASDPANKVLGTSVLDGIPAMPAGQPQIDITLKYDVDGIIHISATERTTGAHIDVTIEGSTKLSDDEVFSLAAAEESLKLSAK